MSSWITSSTTSPAAGDLIRDLVAEGAATGSSGTTVNPSELAGYCLNAISGAGTLPSKAAVSRLVQVTLAGLRPAVPGPP